MSSEIFESIKKQAANVSPFNAKLKFILDDEIILIDGSDGSSNIVTTDDVDADTGNKYRTAVNYEVLA